MTVFIQEVITIDKCPELKGCRNSEQIPLCFHTSLQKIYSHAICAPGDCQLTDISYPCRRFSATPKMSRSPTNDEWLTCRPMQLLLISSH